MYFCRHGVLVSKLLFIENKINIVRCKIMTVRQFKVGTSAIYCTKIDIQHFIFLSAVDNKVITNTQQ